MKIYLTPPLPVGNGPYKSIEHNSPGFLGTWLLSSMSNYLFGCLNTWQISHDAISLRTLRPNSLDGRTDLSHEHINQLLRALATYAHIR